MKKIYCMLMALAAIAFVSCEDVPEPYTVPTSSSGSDSGKVEEPTIGTADEPVTVAQALAQIDAMADGATSTEFAYVKGIIVKVTTNASQLEQYGNLNYYISDDGKDQNTIYIYGGDGLDGDKFTAVTDIKAGDQVVVYGQLQRYVNSSGRMTPEVAKGNYLVSLTKGSDTPDTPSETTGDGTLQNPYNAAAAIALAQQTGEAESADVYIKGKVATVTEQFGTQYGNATFDISDDGTTATTTFTVYRALYLGNTKYTSGDLLQQGDEVVICGKVTNFRGNTPETVTGKAYLYSLNGKTAGGSDDPGTDPNPGQGDGNGTAASPYSVTAALAAGTGTGVYVKAYIVGSVSGQALATGATFSANGDSQTNLLIAASADETTVGNCMPVQLPSGAVRTALNLVDNKGNYKQEVTLYGNIEKYFGVTGLKSVSFAILGGKEIGTNPGGSTTPDTPATDGYKLATAITDGTYILAANTGGQDYVVAKPLTGGYGYLYVENVTLAGEVLAADAANEFTLKAVDGGYTIQDASGQYYYMTGNYNSFNRQEGIPAEGHVWSVTLQGNNVVIKNVLKGKTLQFSTQYTSYGAYTDVTNVLPSLFKK